MKRVDLSMQRTKLETELRTNRSERAKIRAGSALLSGELAKLPTRQASLGRQ